MESSAIFLSLLVLASWIIGEEQRDKNKPLVWRLPTVIRPLSYHLNITVPDTALTTDSNEYSGVVTISLKATRPTQTIQLHASHKYLKLDLITIDQYHLNTDQYFVDCTTDILTVLLEHELETTSIVDLKIEFRGNLSTEDNLGFYKTSHVTAYGLKRYIAVTKMEPAYARRVFPCFDEPLFKTTFEIYITYPIGYNALSNTPGILYKNDSKSETMSFEGTAPMSTYLVAFIVSDFTCSQAESVNSVPVRVCSTTETSNFRDWAVEISPKMLHSLNEYMQFGYEGSMAKLDVVAIADFVSGAMENWGLVTFKESILIWNPLEDLESAKMQIALTTAHEFTHFWMGNLVTCNWWSEIFLNEGLANYFEYIIGDEILPSWELEKQYIVDVLQQALHSDVSNEKSALQSVVNTPTEASAKFDIISYYKGSAIFHMIRNVIGSEKFKKGLRNYVKQYKYWNTLPENLWDKFQEVADNATAKFPSSNLREIMDSWIKKPGYPLVTVRIYNLRIEISQERFLMSGKDKVTKWYIPVCYATAASREKSICKGPDFWLTPKKTVSLKISNKNYKWLLINNTLGYFRVNYDQKGWDNIKNALAMPNFDGIVEVSRAQIVDDVLNLADSGKMRFGRAFYIIWFLANDTSYYTWATAVRNFKILVEKSDPESVLGRAMKRSFLRLMENLYNSTSFLIDNDEDHIFTLKQALTFEAACSFGKDECISLSYAYFLKNKLSGIKPIKNLRATVYCYAMKRSKDETDWEFLWNAYMDSTVDTERLVFIQGLGCTLKKDVLKRYLNSAFEEDSGVKDTEVVPVFKSVCESGSAGFDVAFEFVKKNHARINMYAGAKVLTDVINTLKNSCRNSDQYERLKKFIESNALAQHRQLGVSFPNITNENITWFNKHKPELMKYFLRRKITSSDSEKSVNVHVCVVILFSLCYFIDF